MEFLPSLARARSLLPEDTQIASDPSQTFAAAAIVLQTDGVRREVWDDDVELSERLFEQYPRGAPPAPQLFTDGERNGPFSTTLNYKMIPDDSIGRRGPCTNCAVTRGRVFCGGCNGTGQYFVSDIPSPCSGCNGTGMIPCGACDGSGIAITTKVRYVNDHQIRLRRVFVPNIGKTLIARVTSEIDPNAEWNPSFAFEPQPQVVASAYRGASAVREPDYHGFHFGDALPRTLEAMAELSREKGIVLQANRCYAVPLLWLVYGTDPSHASHVVLVAQPDGSLVSVSG